MMKQISELQSILSVFLNWNKARLNCLTQILQALIKVRTVNLTQIAAAFQTDASEESSYRRVRRFFTFFSFDLSVFVSIVFKLFPLEGKWLLVLDRTSWKWGKTPINILMLSIAYKGIGLPIFWTVLDLEGNSATKERIAILKRVIERLGASRIFAFTADREFVGKEWFEFLSEQQIPFIIRVKGCYVGEEISDKCKVRLKTFCKGLGRKQILNRCVILWGMPLYVSAERKKGAKEPVIVVSNVHFQNALELYRKRWAIETMFGCFKTRGFYIEDTHMTDPEKIERLLFVVGIAFCWAYRLGDLRAEEKPVQIKSHGRPEKSLFRKGLDILRHAIFRKITSWQFTQALKVFTYSKKGGYVL